MSYISDFDIQTTAAVRRLPDKWQPFMSALTFLGEPLVVIAAGFAGFISAINRSQDALIKAFLYAAIAFCLSTILKFILHRRRPNDLIIETLGIKSYSFPSGHAFGTVIFYGLFAYLDFKYLLAPWNYLFGIFITSIILLIGVSRVYLKAHYPSDVIGGWLLGGAFLAVIILFSF